MINSIKEATKTTPSIHVAIQGLQKLFEECQASAPSSYAKKAPKAVRLLREGLKKRAPTLELLTHFQKIGQLAWMPGHIKKAWTPRGRVEQALFFALQSKELVHTLATHIEAKALFADGTLLKSLMAQNGKEKLVDQTLLAFDGDQLLHLLLLFPNYRSAALKEKVAALPKRSWKNQPEKMVEAMELARRWGVLNTNPPFWLLKWSVEKGSSNQAKSLLEMSKPGSAKYNLLLLDSMKRGGVDRLLIEGMLNHLSGKIDANQAKLIARLFRHTRDAGHYSALHQKIQTMHFSLNAQQLGELIEAQSLAFHKLAVGDSNKETKRALVWINDGWTRLIVKHKGLIKNLNQRVLDQATVRECDARLQLIEQGVLKPEVIHPVLEGIHNMLLLTDYKEIDRHEKCAGQLWVTMAKVLDAEQITLLPQSVEFLFCRGQTNKLVWLPVVRKTALAIIERKELSIERPLIIFELFRYLPKEISQEIINEVVEALFEQAKGAPDLWLPLFDWHNQLEELLGKEKRVTIGLELYKQTIPMARHNYHSTLRHRLLAHLALTTWIERGSDLNQVHDALLEMSKTASKEVRWEILGYFLSIDMKRPLSTLADEEKEPYEKAKGAFLQLVMGKEVVDPGFPLAKNALVVAASTQGLRFVPARQRAISFHDQLVLLEPMAKPVWRHYYNALAHTARLLAKIDPLKMEERSKAAWLASTKRSPWDLPSVTLFGNQLLNTAALHHSQYGSDTILGLLDSIEKAGVYRTYHLLLPSHIKELCLHLTAAYPRGEGIRIGSALLEKIPTRLLPPNELGVVMARWISDRLKWVVDVSTLQAFEEMMRGPLSKRLYSWQVRRLAKLLPEIPTDLRQSSSSSSNQK